MLRRLIPVFLSLACAPQLPSILTTEASCGDGHLDSGSGEACDDGNQDQTDDCLNNCQLARCGDGTVRRHQNEGDPVETCDDGNSNDRDACTNACETARCGDGILRSDLDLDDGAYEVCDDGNEFSGDLCTINCRLPSCGDGWRQGDEGCDDGNEDHLDACSNDCTVARCGDAIVQTWEACDEGPENDPFAADGCRVGCIAASCGDGILDSDEACDDGDDLVTNGCIECAPSACGDGHLRTDIRLGDIGFEACDDGNLIPSDECTADCQIARCGDGIVWEGREFCDDGNDDPSDGCSVECLVDDYSNQFTGASTLDTATPSPGAFHFDGDLDTFIYQAQTSGVHRFFTGDLANAADPTCLLYSAQEQLMATSDDIEAGNFNCGLEVALTTDEVVYLQLRHYRASGRGSYRVYTVAPCGNGYLDEMEACDPTSRDGNPFACRADCQPRRTIGLGVQHGCALAEDQTFCWGYNGTLMAGALPEDSPWLGSCAHNDCVASPNQVSGFRSPLDSVTCAIDGICGVDRQGIPYCWGANPAWRGITAETINALPFCPADLDAGPCNHDDDCFGNQSCRGGRCQDNFPGRCSGEGLSLGPAFQAGRTYRGIAAGFSHLCAVRSDGTVDCWGVTFGQDVGARGFIGPSHVTTPQPVQGLQNIVFTDSALYSNCALDRDGQVHCWGQNDRGQLSVAETAPELSHPAAQAGGLGFSSRPIQVRDLPPVVDLDMGWVTACAVTERGVLYCWGSSQDGLLGRDIDDECLGQYCRFGPEPVDAPEPIVSVAVGRQHACAVGFSGRLYCWGRTLNGALGLGRDLGVLGPLIELPQMVGRLNHVVEVAVSGGGEGNTAKFHTCAKTQVPGRTARLYCWGANGFGQLGIGTIDAPPTDYVPVPTRVY